MLPLSVLLRAGAPVLFAANIALFSGCAKRADEPAPKPAAAAAAANVAPPAAAVPEQVRKVMGRWLREDGGYVLEIRGGATGGVLEALYFNPRSIHVSRAAWYEGAGVLQVLIELNDTGYPGATYILHHDPKTDRLAGEYRQPAMQQSFQIEFVREPKP